MSRLKLVLLVGGVMLAWFGVQELRVSRGTTDEPLDVALADVEQGKVPENNHWRLGEHFALYNACVYEYEQSRGAVGEPNAMARVNYCYYPVVSNEHPLIQKLAELVSQYGDLDQAPQDEIPPLNGFAVVVKTKQFSTIGSIPSEWDKVAATEGLVINTIGSLKSDEAKMFKESFPQLNTDKLVILEAGRKPASLAKSGGMIGGGLAVSLAGLAWMIAGRRSA